MDLTRGNIKTVAKYFARKILVMIKRFKAGVRFLAG